MGQRPLVEKVEASLLVGMDFSFASSSKQEIVELILLEQQVIMELQCVEQSHCDVIPVGTDAVPIDNEAEVGLKNIILQADGAENHEEGVAVEEEEDDESGDVDSSSNEDYQG
ncbi:hypothetical protein Ocin01_10322 [Orchesella cincta]|uniref:Uncharacterized protein n=1 Tax=Orchesella cincta TaxID=48709 RepID=A0A1D2MUH8_ORCCI|nr:hypothetical protein Ocin01_10322 [Orchesella cincta]